MIRRLASISILIGLSWVSVFAQQKPDFSGTWKLNVAKSDFGPLPGPESRTDVITHKEPSLSNSVTAQSAQGKQEYTVNYTTDGKEVQNKVGPRDIKSTLKWVGSNLVITSKFVYNDTDVTSESTWNLSPDGKTITISAHFSSSMGDADQKLIFEKQEGGAAVVPAPTKTAP
jgi:hypothetical protein